MKTFIQNFRDVTDPEGAKRDWSPAACIDAWRSFVLDCEDGYQWSIYEYENELEIRDVIDQVLSASELTRYPELPIFADTVAEVDERFAALLSTGPALPRQSAVWWHAGLPGYAGPDLVADAKTQYGVQLRLVEL